MTIKSYRVIRCDKMRDNKPRRVIEDSSRQASCYQGDKMRAQLIKSFRVVGMTNSSSPLFSTDLSLPTSILGLNSLMNNGLHLNSSKSEAIVFFSNQGPNLLKPWMNPTTCHMRQSVTCDNPSHATIRHMRQSVTCDNPSHATIRHMRQSVTCDNPSHATIRHIYLTVHLSILKNLSVYLDYIKCRLASRYLKAVSLI